ncbi:PREDICTED: E3 ubiquitin-protein ligase RHA1B-like [Camelina sativa]|uniref:E3 ubiquitin-protein ligase RHA1B-like n=1 Tax=Camelina sativa TaxID=90675 RepID=A0ABM0YM03_CAMSA|nr:PREDICTED: E3 ubiquitin-protein ligase RHA1B-like [Camelina sativa]
MTFFIEDTSLIISHLFYKTAVIIAVLRWIFACILRYRSRSSPRSSSPSVSSQTIKESLAVTAFCDAVERSPSASISDTCAVCLGDLEDDDEIRELRNCTHVFHRDCIDRWLDYECRGGGDEDDNHRTCPLCRTPLLPSFSDCSTVNQPSWAVERLLYLFGDDLLP